MSQSNVQASAWNSWAVAERKPAAAGTRTPARAHPLPAEASEWECRKLLLDHLDFVERTVTSIALRHALNEWEADDLGGQVKLRLVSDDYAILRKFQGKSRVTTYLTTVIHNLFRDFRIQQWGKWRPSAAACRLGDVGIQLEALLYRDRFGFDEAVEILRARYDVQMSLAELVEMAGRLRVRTSRRFESDAVLMRLEANEQGDQRVVDGERAALQERVAAALSDVLAALEAEDRLILKLRFVEGLTIRGIAISLDLDQRRIYARVRRVLRRVREGVVDQGFHSEEILDLLDWPACVVEVGLSDSFPLLSGEAT